MSVTNSQKPRQVVLFAALLNLFGDFFLCAWPFHFGIMGAAAATALSTLMGFQMMWQALKRTGGYDTGCRGLFLKMGLQVRIFYPTAADGLI